MTSPTPEQMVEIVRPQMSVTRERVLESRLRECIPLLEMRGLTPTGQMVVDGARAAIDMPAGAQLDPAAWNTMLAALYECEEYFDGRQDVVDGDYGVPEANKEMKLLMEVREAIAKAAP